MSKNPIEEWLVSKSAGDLTKKMSLWDLASLNPSSYRQLYTACVEPKLEDFRDHKFNGLILLVHYGFIGKIGISLYTGTFFNTVFGVFSSRSLSFQKRFLKADNDQKESGINFWPLRNTEAMPMKIYLSPSIVNKELKSLKVDYNVPANLSIIVKPIIDDIRQIPNSSFYLGCMYYRLFGLNIPFLWFALSQCNE